MVEDHALNKTNRINMLLDFYEKLLTEKQRNIIQYYFHDDYSLGEIAEMLQISRQAVYEHIKRAELALEEYEDKLRLAAKHEQRKAYYRQAMELLKQAGPERSDTLEDLLHKLYHAD